MRLVVSILLIGSLVAPDVWAETKILKKGDPAPFDGILCDQACSTQWVEDERDNRKHKAIAEDLSTEVVTLQEKVVDLETASEQQTKALIIAEDRDKQRAVIEQQMAKALENNQKAFDMMERSAKVAIDAAEQSSAALAKMHDKVDAANSRGFWGMLFSAAIGIFTGAYLGR